MIRFLIIISLLLFIIQNIFAENQSEQIKRTILLLPFINKNKVEKYDYLRDSLLNALNSELIRTYLFNFTNPVEVELIMDKEKEPADYYDKIENAIDIADKLKADVIVIGQYVIIENEINIQIKSIDVFTGEIVASTNLRGELGVDVFRIIDESSKDITDKMAKKLKAVDKSYFNEMLKVMNQKKLNNFRKSINPVNITGISFLSVGSTLLLTGIPIFIYDLAGYSSIYSNRLTKYNNDEIGYSDLYPYYQIFIGLFISSIILSGTGLIFAIVSIPLIIYKNKKQKVTLNIKYDFNKNDIDLFFKIKI